MIKVLYLIVILFATSMKAGELPPIADWAGQVQPLTIGSYIPNATLWTVNGDPIHLKKLVQKKPTVIIFYQGGWSPFCSDQLADLNEITVKLDKMGFQLIAISPDSPYKVLKSRKKKHLDYTLLSDYHLEAARAFGLAYRVSWEKAKLYKKKYGAELRHIKGEESYNLPVPGVFLADDKGKIHFQYVNPDVKARLSPGLLIEAAKMVTSNAKASLKSKRKERPKVSVLSR